MELKHIIVYSFNNILLITTLFHNPFDTCMMAVEECYGNAMCTSKTIWWCSYKSDYVLWLTISMYLKYHKCKTYIFLLFICSQVLIDDYFYGSSYFSIYIYMYKFFYQINATKPNSFQLKLISTNLNSFIKIKFIITNIRQIFSKIKELMNVRNEIKIEYRWFLVINVPKHQFIPSFSCSSFHSSSSFVRSYVRSSVHQSVSQSVNQSFSHSLIITSIRYATHKF